MPSGGETVSFRRGRDAAPRPIFMRTDIASRVFCFGGWSSGRLPRKQGIFNKRAVPRRQTRGVSGSIMADNARPGSSSIALAAKPPSGECRKSQARPLFVARDKRYFLLRVSVVVFARLNGPRDDDCAGARPYRIGGLPYKPRGDVLS